MGGWGGGIKKNNTKGFKYYRNKLNEKVQNMIDKIGIKENPWQAKIHWRAEKKLCE